jgi:hypothetical protein
MLFSHLQNDTVAISAHCCWIVICCCSNTRCGCVLDGISWSWVHLFVRFPKCEAILCVYHFHLQCWCSWWSVSLLYPWSLCETETSQSLCSIFSAVWSEGTFGHYAVMKLFLEIFRSLFPYTYHNTKAIWKWK